MFGCWVDLPHLHHRYEICQTGRNIYIESMPCDSVVDSCAARWGQLVDSHEVAAYYLQWMDFWRLCSPTYTSSVEFVYHGGSCLSDRTQSDLAFRSNTALSTLWIHDSEVERPLHKFWQYNSLPFHCFGASR